MFAPLLRLGTATGGFLSKDVIVILKILSIFSALAIVFCCAVPASAANIDLNLDMQDFFEEGITAEDFDWELIDELTPSELVDLSNGYLTLNSSGSAVMTDEHSGTIIRFFDVGEPDPENFSYYKVSCDFEGLIRIPFDDTFYFDSLSSFDYHGALVNVAVLAIPSYPLVFRGAKLYKAVEKGSLAPLPERFPAIPTALTFILSCFSSMFVLIIDNPVLCIGLSLFAIGGAIGLFNKIKG